MSEELKAKILAALTAADNVMSYCQGDTWERECTKGERELFDRLMNEIVEELK